MPSTIPPPATVESESEDETSSRAPTESSGRNSNPQSTTSSSAVGAKAEDADRTPRKQGERRTTDTKVEAGQPSSKAGRTPSRAPSSRSHTSRPEVREDAGQTDARRHERKHSRSSTASQAALPPLRTSPQSSRSSRAPSTGSREEMPPPAIPVRTQSRGHANIAARGPRPSSYHDAMSPMEPWYPLAPPAQSAYEHGPPPSRSAYLHARPALAVVTGPPGGYLAPVRPQEMIPIQYRPVLVPNRSQSDYLSGSQGPVYSARRAVQHFRDTPSAFDASPVSAPAGHSPERAHQYRKPLSARRPQHPATFGDHVLDDDYSDSGSGSGYDDEQSPPMYPLARRRSQRESTSVSERTVSARGMPGFYGTNNPQAHDYPYSTSYDNHFDNQSDYLSSRYASSSGSSHHRRQSISSGTRGTAYSASSGSARQPGSYADSIDPTTSAELYMQRKDREARHTREQLPQLTQESLRAQAKQIADRQSSRVGGTSASPSKHAPPPSSYRVEDEQAVRIRFSAAGGFRIEGDTEGRPIELSQEPGADHAELVIGTGPNRRTAETVHNSGGGGTGSSSGRTRVSAAKMASRVTEQTSRSSKAAISSRRERARTTGEY